MPYTVRDGEYFYNLELYDKLRDKKYPSYSAETKAVSVLLYYGSEKVLDGVFIPGEYRVTPYMSYRDTIEDGDGAETVCYVGEDSTYVYTLTVSGDWHLLVTETARRTVGGVTSKFGNGRERALAQAMAKLGSPECPLGEDLGEIRETLEFLRSPFKGFRDFLCSADYRRLGLLNKLLHYRKTGRWSDRGGRLLSKRKAAIEAASTWLEFRYGLMPLVHTTEGIIDLVNKKAQKLDPERIRSVRAKVKTEVYEHTRASSLISLTNVSTNVYAQWKQKFTASVQYRNAGVPTLAELLGLTPQHLPETMWGLTHLSYVVDWWFDVSSWLGSWRINPGITVLGNTVGARVDRTLTMKSRFYNDDLSGLEPTVPVPDHVRRYYRRYCQYQVPTTPQLTLEYTSFNHLVDALALIIQPTLNNIKR